MNASLAGQGPSTGSLSHLSERGLVPLAIAKCYYQDQCEDHLTTVFRCKDVFWPCGLFGPWHSFERAMRHSYVCPVKGETIPCVMYYECLDWERIQCCDEEFDHCPPTNPRCQDYEPCPIGEP